MIIPTLLRFQSAAVAIFAAMLFANLPFVHAADALPDEATLHAELRAWVPIYEKAISSGDLSPLEPLFDVGTSGVVVNNQTFKSFDELKAIYAKFYADFPGVVYKVTLNPEPSQLFGDLAVAHGTCDEYVKTAAGTEFTYTSTWTAVLRRVDGKWKLVRSQVTMDPFQNSIVQYFVKQAEMGYGLGGLAIGVIGGLLAGFLLKRKSARA